MPPNPSSVESPSSSLLKQRKPYRRILVIRYRFIGDTLMVTPFLRELKKAYPEALIDVLVGPYSGEVLTHCPEVNELIYYDTTRKHRYENQSGGEQKSFWSYVGQLRKNKYDVAYVLKRSFSSAALAFFSGIPKRIGYATEARQFLLTQSISYDKQKSEADCFLDILRADGIPVSADWEKHYAHHHWWGPDQEDLATAMMEQYAGETNVLVHFTSSNSAKEWPQEKALSLVERLIDELDAIVHCVGASSDAQVYEQIRQRLPEPMRDRLLNWCGHTDLVESMALIAKMDVMVGVDSGTLHMAAAVGVPVVGLFGPMSPEKWRPLGEKTTVVSLGLACQPCNLKTPCHQAFACMTNLSVEQVMQAVLLQVAVRC
jgi:heptosyltransferase II